jgi:hypothetical protein
VSTLPDALVIERLDGGRLVLHAHRMAAHFFAVDPSSIGINAYDSMSGKTARDRLETRDVLALNQTMRARTPHAAWAALLDRDLDWLKAIPPGLDLIEAPDNQWRELAADDLIRAALASSLGFRRGISVTTKMLHLKRPRLFPVLDSLVAQMLGATLADEAPVAVRVERALELTLHLRKEGARNLTILSTIQRQLEESGVERSLVRILDAALWLSHPAAGTNVARSVEVKLL